MEVGGCHARGCFVGKHQSLELIESHDCKPAQRDEKWCDMGSLGLIENKTRCCILNHFAEV